MKTSNKTPALGKGLLFIVVLFVVLSTSIQFIGAKLAFGLNSEKFLLEEKNSANQNELAIEKELQKKNEGQVKGITSDDAADSKLPQTTFSVKAVEDEITQNSLVFRLKVFFLDTIQAVAAKFDADVEIGGDLTVANDVEVGNDLVVDGSLITSEAITAPNVVYSIVAGTGVTVSGEQDVTIANSDLGSSQNIFKNFKIGSNTISASSNSDTVTWEGGSGITISNDGKTITVSASGSDLNVSGWSDDGSSVRLTTISDNVGIGTNTPAYKLHVIGDGYVSGNLTIAGSTIFNGFNNNNGGITNAGSITGATGFTSSGTITFSDFSKGVLQSNFSGTVTSTALNLGAGSELISGLLPVTNGGTGLGAYTVGDIVYAFDSDTLTQLNIGGDGQVLTVVSGVPAWTTLAGSGGACDNCLVNNPGSTQTITPSVATATGLRVRQAASGSVDVFSVTNNDGTTKYLYVDSSGNVHLGNGAATSGNLTVAPSGTDPIAIAPVSAGSNTFTGSITSLDLTADRTWTFPDATGVICLSTGNCTGTSAGVGGSGTTNYLPRWVGTYAIGDSLIYDDGTNVGISTTIPTAKFHVQGSGLISGVTTVGGRLYAQENIDVSGAATISGTLVVGGATDIDSTLGVSGATTLASTLSVTGGTTVGGNLFVNGTGTSYISGNLGIGTTSPSAPLTLANGSYKMDFVQSGAVWYLAGAGATNEVQLRQGNNGIFISTSSTQLRNNNTQGLILNSDTDVLLGGNAGTGNQTMTVLGTGNVGIGTTTPSYKLHVYGTGQQTSMLYNATVSDPSYVYQLTNLTESRTYYASDGFGGTGGYPISVGVTGSTGFSIKHNTTDYLTIINGGNVGIGTTSPTSRLHVASGNISTNYSILATDVIVAGSYALQGSGGYLQIGNSSGWSGGLSLFGGSTEKMRINSSGNVGIGTTSPIGLLNISGAATGKALTILNQTGDQNIFVASSSGTTVLAIDTSGNLAIEGSLSDITGNSVQINDSLQVTGAVSVATGLSTNGDTTLGNATNDLITFTARAASSLLPTTSNTYDLGSDSLRWANVYATALYQNGNQVCDASGNCDGVGGGGTSQWTTANGSLYPIHSSVDLLLGSSASSSAKFAFLNVNTGTPTASISANSGSIATYLTGDGTLATTNRQTLTLGNSTSYNTTGNLLIHPNGTGFVGIGTTTPAYQLDLVGELNLTDAIRVAGDAGTSGFILTSSGGGAMTWTDPGSLTSGSTTYWTNTANVLHPKNEYAGVVDLVLGDTATASADIRLSSNGQAYFGGNVGIGTTSAGSKLQVNAGQIRVGDEFTTAVETEGLLLGKDNSGVKSVPLEFLMYTGGSGNGYRFQPRDLGGSNFNFIFSSRSNATSWTDVYSITPGGRLGMGTLTPDALLEVSNDILDNFQPALFISNESGSTYDPVLTYKIGASSIFTMGVDDSDSDSFKIDSSGSLGSSVFTITTADLVGILDSTPDAVFDVDGSVNFDLPVGSGVVVDADTLDATIDVLSLDIGTLTDGVDGVNLDLNVTGNTGDDADTFAGLNVLLANNANDQTTDDNLYGLYIQNLGGTAKDGNEYAIFQEGTGWDYGLYVSDDAHFNAGVDVAGAVTIAGDAGTSGYVLTSSGGGAMTWTDTSVFSGGAGAYWTNTANVLHPKNEYATVVDMILGSTATASANVHLESNGKAYFAGNVGIGSTSPAYKLDVVGNINLSSGSTLGIGGTALVRYNTSNADNLFFGNGGATSGSTDDYNLSIGIGALTGLNNSNGDYNVAIGYNALNAAYNTSQRNIAIGYAALAADTVIDDSIAIGYNAMAAHTSGNGINIAIGSFAFDQATGGERNVVVGYNSMGGGSASGSRNVVIGNEAFSNGTTGSDNTIVGQGAANNLQSGGNNAFFGSAAGSGVTTGSSNTCIGVSACGSGTITGSENIAIGKETGRSNLTGANNILFGSGNGSLTSGARNIFIGPSAGRNVTTGNDNIFMGNAANYQATSNLTGHYNIMIGGNGGYQGLGGSSTGNIIIGRDAGSSLDDDDNYNVLLGYQAGYNETGSNKLYIENTNTSSPLIYGDFSSDIVGINGQLGVATQAPTGKFEVNGKQTGKALAILNETGNQAVFVASVSGVNKFTISNSGNVGIGTASPNSLLNLASGALTIGTSGDCNNDFCLDDNGIDSFFDYTITNHNSGSLYLMPDGNVGIGTTTTSSKLDVYADRSSQYAAEFFNDGNNANRYGLLVQAGLDDQTAAGPSTLVQFNDGDGDAVGSITFGSSVTNYNTSSDIRLKNDFGQTSLGLQDLLNITVHDYAFKADSKQTLHTGFMAQELYQIYPDAVTAYSYDANKYWQIDYGKLTPLLVRSIQEQNDWVEKLSIKIDETGEVVTNLGSKLDDSQNQLEIPSLAHLLDGYATLTQAVWTFMSEVVFDAKAKFMASVEFVKDVTFNGSIRLSKENAGTVVIPSGVIKVRVSFDRSFSQVPNIYLTNKDNLSASVRIAEVTTEYFVLELNKSQENDTSVQWLAVLAEQTGNERIEVLEIDAAASSNSSDETAQQTEVNITGEVAGDTTEVTGEQSTDNTDENMQSASESAAQSNVEVQNTANSTNSAEIIEN